MTKEELAAKLNGRTIGNELTREEEAEAWNAGLIVVFGASDDLCEFRGLMHDETGGDRVIGIRSGLVVIHSTDDEMGANALVEQGWTPPQSLFSVKSEWCPDEPTGASWLISTDLPHATFDIMEDGEIYCRGIVFEVPKASADPVTAPSEMERIIDTVEPRSFEAAPVATPDGLVSGYEEQIAKLQAFKDYVHKRLDDYGVPTHPEGPHTAQGCRIGDRLDYVLKFVPR